MQGLRDLLPLQTRLLAEAAFLAAQADEPLEQNFVRKHALAYQEAHVAMINCHCKQVESAEAEPAANEEAAKILFGNVDPLDPWGDHVSAQKFDATPAGALDAEAEAYLNRPYRPEWAQVPLSEGSEFESAKANGALTD
jgi:hypothetical protein